MTFTPLAQVGPYTVLHLPGEGPDLILSCASIGHDLSRPPSPEWAATTRPHPTLFLIDASRSWGTAPGLDLALTQALKALPRPARILALGSSMGAVLALAASHVLPLHALIALGPQHRPAAPWEARWRDLTAALPPDWTAPASRAAQTWVLHAGDDGPQAQGFADPILFPDQTHSTLARHLKPAMPGLIAAALSHDRRRFLRLTSAAGGLHAKRTRCA